MHAVRILRSSLGFGHSLPRTRRDTLPANSIKKGGVQAWEAASLRVRWSGFGPPTTFRSSAPKGPGCVPAGIQGPRWIMLTPEIIAELRKPVQRHWKRRNFRQHEQNMVQ